MPFGKHKGEHLQDIPPEYLEWLYDNVSLNDSALLNELARIIRRDACPADSRDKTDWKAKCQQLEVANKKLTFDLSYAKLQLQMKSMPASAADVAAWYRKMAMEFHPDKRGGSNEAMKAINRAKEVLEGR